MLANICLCKHGDIPFAPECAATELVGHTAQLHWWCSRQQPSGGQGTQACPGQSTQGRHAMVSSSMQQPLSGCLQPLESLAITAGGLKGDDQRQNGTKHRHPLRLRGLKLVFSSLLAACLLRIPSSRPQQVKCNRSLQRQHCPGCMSQFVVAAPHAAMRQSAHLCLHRQQLLGSSQHCCWRCRGWSLVVPCANRLM